MQADLSTGVLVGVNPRPLYSDDAALILGLENALLIAGAAATTATYNVAELLSLGRWLFENEKPGIAARLFEGSLTRDVEEFRGKGHARNVLTALNHLRAFQLLGGVAPIPTRAVLNPHPDDAALVKQYKEAAPATGLRSKTARNYRGVLTSFSDYLRENNKESIAARLHDKSLDQDVAEFKKTAPSVRAALNHLRAALSGAVIAPVTGRASLDPHPNDGALIEEYKKAAPRNSVSKDTARTYASALKAFSDYLRRNNKQPITGRLDHNSLDEDVTSYKKESGGHGSIGAALGHLLQTLRGDGAPELTRHVQATILPEHAGLMDPRPVDGTNVLHSGSQPFSISSWPGTREDEPLISALKEQLLKAGYAEATVKTNLVRLRRLSGSLFANNKPGIAARLQDTSLDEDFAEFRSTAPYVLTPLSHLRAAQSAGGIVPRLKGRTCLDPHPEDAALIEQYKGAAPGDSRGTAKKYATALKGFSDYLRRNNKQPIIGRLYDNSLDEDVTSYRKEPGSNARIGAALVHLLQMLPGDGAPEVGRDFQAITLPEHAGFMDPRPVDDAIVAHSRSQPFSWPEVLAAEGEDRDLLWDGVALAGHSWPVEGVSVQQGAPQQAFNWPEVLAEEGYNQDLLWDEVNESGESSPLEATTRHHQAWDAGAFVAPLSWPSDRYWASNEVGGALDKSNRTPGEQIPSWDEHDAAELRAAKRQRTLNNWQDAAIERQLSELVNSDRGVLTQATTHHLGAPWELRPAMEGSGQAYAAAPYAAGNDAMFAASPVQLGQSVRVLTGHSRDPLNAPAEAFENEAVLASSLQPTALQPQGPDFGQAARDLNGRHGHQRAPDELIAALHRSSLLPSEEVPLTSFFLGDNISVPTPDLPPPFVGPTPGDHQDLQPLDIGEFIGHTWTHRPQEASSFVIDILQNLGLLPNEDVPMTSFLIHGEPYTAENLPNGGVLLFHRPQAG
ncbi:hypothetical protein [Bradyrhizobium sp. STM 3562]|uniref:hypothetical protein n=1 Tax=Bradyrhizobium sp. STM 3562 TaxID=578924 RepID=UPI00388D398B